MNPQPKSKPVRDEEYRRKVAQLPCVHCGVYGQSQCAHADQGKGMGIKASDHDTMPLCGPHYTDDGRLYNGCHYEIGTSGKYTKARRRDLEAVYVARTRKALGIE